VIDAAVPGIGAAQVIVAAVQVTAAVLQSYFLRKE
jgi:hypothetical protein